MEILLFWFGVSIAIGIWASNKGRNGFGWFVLAVLISPILAGLFLAASKDLSVRTPSADSIPSPSTHVTCPDCAEFVLKQARVCKHCGCKLIPVQEDPPPDFAGSGMSGSQILGLVLALALLTVLIYGMTQS